jgi:hypothetical protein
MTTADQKLLSWAAQLVRLMAGASLARDVDRDVAEPVRRIALEMRDEADRLKELGRTR